MEKDNQSGLIRVFRGHLRDVRNVYEMPDGRLVSVARDLALRLWDRKGQFHRILHTWAGYNQNVRITKDGYIMAFANTDEGYELHVWDDQQRLIFISNQQEYYGSHDISYMLNSGLLLTTTQKGVLQLWYPHGAVYRVMRGHTGSVRARELQNGQILSWGVGTYGGYSPDKIIRLWSADGLPIREFNHHSTNALQVIQLQNGNLVSYSAIPDENQGYDQTTKPIFIWDLDGQFFKTISGHLYDVANLWALKDGRFISAGDNNVLHLHNEAGLLLGIMKQHTYVIRLIELQNRRILAWAEDYQLHVWQLPLIDTPASDTNIKSVALLDDGGQWIYLHSMIELPDGRIITCGSNNIINVWQLPNEIQAGSVISPIKRLVGHRGEVNRLVLLSDGSFVSCGKDGTICLWSV